MVIDEAQNLTPLEVKTIITRVGQWTKIVFTGDPYQIDNPYVDSSSNGFRRGTEAAPGADPGCCGSQSRAPFWPSVFGIKGTPRGLDGSLALPSWEGIGKSHGGSVEKLSVAAMAGNRLATGGDLLILEI
jgi:hypothetical protein